MTTTDLKGASAVTDDKCNDDETALDLKQFKVIGLNLILDRGAVGSWTRAACMWYVRLATVIYLVQVVGLYDSAKDLRRFSTMFMQLIFGLNNTLKAYTLVTNADQIRAILAVARYDYTECGHRRPANMQMAGAMISKLLWIYIVVFNVAVFSWIITPLFTGVSYVQIDHIDGTTGSYRVTIDNLWLPGMSETVYNWTPVWAVIYATEVKLMLVNPAITVISNCLIITMCFVFTAQFRTLVEAYETIGYQKSTLCRGSQVCCRFDEEGPIKNSDKNMHGNSDGGDMGCLDYYEELIVYIKDNQSIIKKYDTFIENFHSVIISQIIVESIFMMALVIIFNQSFLVDKQTNIGLALKLFLTFITVTTTMYTFCYCFNNINLAMIILREYEKLIFPNLNLYKPFYYNPIIDLISISDKVKSSLNFALYSSNWTAMDLKFKKTLLLAMHMNSAHKKIMKFSPKYNINLELFIVVIKAVYSVISVILNTTKKK